MKIEGSQRSLVRSGKVMRESKVISLDCGEPQKNGDCDHCSGCTPLCTHVCAVFFFLLARFTLSAT